MKALGQKKRGTFAYENVGRKKEHLKNRSKKDTAERTSGPWAKGKTSLKAGRENQVRLGRGGGNHILNAQSRRKRMRKTSENALGWA